ncbi:hypothetical protein [Methylomonas sp. MgM2]
MKKVKAFNVLITLAAFAALYFLLPSDNDSSNVTVDRIEASTSQQNRVTKKAYQHPPVRDIFLHNA